MRKVGKNGKSVGVANLKPRKNRKISKNRHNRRVATSVGAKMIKPVSAQQIAK